MSGHRPFSDMTKRMPTAGKVRIDEKATALNSALTLHELRKARPGSQDEPEKGAIGGALHLLGRASLGRLRE